LPADDFVTTPDDFPGSNSFPRMWTAGGLAAPMPVFPVNKTCSEVFDWFTENSAQTAAAVVDGEHHVVGIANRLRFMARYAQRFAPELYGKHSIMKLANAKPLIVDENVSVLDLATTLTLEHPDALRECFVVTRDERYLGIGTSEALVRCKMAILGARESELQSALLIATDASKTKSHFLALMSHELRTPLNAIIGFSEILATEMYGPLGTGRYREYASDIHAAGRHLLALINDILDLSKAEAGKLDLHLEAVDIAALVADCVRLTSERAREQDVRVSIRAPADLPALHADALRMKQVVLNLLTNAIKFTLAGGNVEVAAEIGRDGEFVLSVRDTGIGMAPEMIPLALEPFRQIASPFTRNVEGTGLGLSLVKMLTEQHGGEIAIESTPSLGTLVRLRFPASRTLWPQAALTA
jgi:two-component system cell cycle sensor histidine kinase PleC